MIKKEPVEYIDYFIYDPREQQEVHVLSTLIFILRRCAKGLA